jgi:alcohol dehydrogenase
VCPRPLLANVLDSLPLDAAPAPPLAERGRALGSTASSEAARIDDAVALTAELGQRIGLPPSLAALGLDIAELPRVAELGMASARLVSMSPLRADAGLLLEILDRAHAGTLTKRSTR